LAKFVVTDKKGVDEVLKEYSRYLKKVNITGQIRDRKFYKKKSKKNFEAKKKRILKIHVHNKWNTDSYDKKRI